ncbi:MAG TPA: hypothetical protein VM925_25895 [Labilithrix sp.]|nr:hypothetical protein [Labilithrix sp.]
MPRSLRPVARLVGVGALAAAVVLACEDDPHRRTNPGQVLGGGGACEAKPGELPKPDCDNSAKSCAPTPGCVLDEARCGSTSTCLPTASNEGKSLLDFRIRRLNIAAPAALASPFIQNTVVNSGIDLDAPFCGESGQGLFTWLVRVDKVSGTLVTGGAPPARDPFGQGFCFARFELNGRKIEPITAKIEPVTPDTPDIFRTLDRHTLNIPIFLSDQLSSAIILPIQDARIEGVTLSGDGKALNCIGAFNAAALDPSCTEDRELCSKWTTAGALGGFITLEDADGVKIRDLNNKSLCAFLAAESGLACARDGQGKIVYLGDYCSTDKSAGSCRDSVWLAATFAASAAKIFDGNGIVEGCSGAATGPVDAGSDADAGDAASDGGADAQ